MLSLSVCWKDHCSAGQIWLDCDLAAACRPIVGLTGDSLDVKLPFMDSLVMRSRSAVCSDWLVGAPWLLAAI